MCLMLLDMSVYLQLLLLAGLNFLSHHPTLYSGGLREHFACWKSCWTNLTCWTTLCDAGLKPAVNLRLRVPPR